MGYQCMEHGYSGCVNCENVKEGKERNCIGCPANRGNCPLISKLMINGERPDKACEKCHYKFKKQPAEGVENMIDNNAAHLIEQAVKAEYNAAIAAHGGFHSHHEAWAVLKEEAEEIYQESNKFKQETECDLNNLWYGVKADRVPEDKKTSKALERIRTNALAIAHECTQVAAMCDKWNLLISEEQDGE